MHTPSVLFIGEEPESVDFSDPALPPGLNASKIHQGLDTAMKEMAARGWQAELCLVDLDNEPCKVVEKQLAVRPYDCVVIGGGIRVPPRRLAMFEQLINAVHRGAPNASIAFNTQPENTADAAARWMQPRNGADGVASSLNREG